MKQSEYEKELRELYSAAKKQEKTSLAYHLLEIGLDDIGTFKDELN